MRCLGQVESSVFSTSDSASYRVCPKNTPWPRYQTRQFGARVSFPITSDLRKSLEEESGKEKRSMASLAREAIADFIPRLRDRRRKRSRKGTA